SGAGRDISTDIFFELIQRNCDSKVPLESVIFHTTFHYRVFEEVGECRLVSTFSEYFYRAERNCNTCACCCTEFPALICVAAQWNVICIDRNLYYEIGAETNFSLLSVS